MPILAIELGKSFEEALGIAGLRSGTLGQCRAVLRGTISSAQNHADANKEQQASPEMQAHLVEKAKNKVPGTGSHFSSKSTSGLVHDVSELVCGFALIPARTLSSVRASHIRATAAPLRRNGCRG